MTWNLKVLAAAKTDTLEIAIYDVIGKSFFGDGVSAEEVLAALGAKPNAATIIRINSPGGILDEAKAMMNVLAERAARGVSVEFKVDSIAASAASYLLTTPGAKVTVASNAFVMVHKARAGKLGTAADFEAMAAQLRAEDNVLAAGYAAASAARGKGKTSADFLAEMANDADRYFTAAETVEWGLADTTTEGLKIAACAIDISSLANAPDELRAAPYAQPIPTPVAAIAPVVTEQEPTPEPPAPLPSPAQEPPEKTNMTDTNEPNHATPTVARALGLPTGATESDIVVAITRCRELELQIMGITGAQLTAEAVGALRGIKAKADRCDALDAELTQVKAERDQQNFDALVMKGQSNPVKLTPATAKMYADEFTAAKADGRGSEVVARLRGFLDVAPTIHALSRPAGTQPAVRGTGASAPTTHNGKAYAELKPLERARLAQNEPELFRAMKNEHEASQASA